MKDVNILRRFYEAATELRHKAEAAETPAPDIGPRKRPGSLNKDSQKRIHEFVFSTSVKNLQDAKERHRLLIDALDDGQAK